MKTNLFTALLDKLPSSRAALRKENATLRSKLEVEQAHLAHDRGALNSALHRESELRDAIAMLKQKRADLQRQFDDLRELVVRQAASVEVLSGDRQRAEQRIAELMLTVGEDKQREERFLRTIDTLNETLRDQNEEHRVASEELADMKAEQAARSRPVLFRRDTLMLMSEAEIEQALAGKAQDRTIKAIEQLLDLAAVQAMDEAATAPTTPILEGPYATRGFTETDRTFSSGGVFALCEFKRRLTEALTPKHQAERKAA